MSQATAEREEAEYRAYQRERQQRMRDAAVRRTAWEQFVKVFTAQPKQVAKLASPGLITRRSAERIFGCAVLVATALLVSMWWIGASDIAWLGFAVAVFFAAFVILALPGGFSLELKTIRYVEAAVSLRQAAINGDRTQASENDAEATTALSLYGLQAHIQPDTTILGTLIMFIGADLMFLYFAGSQGPAAFLIGAAVCLLIGAILIARNIVIRRPSCVVVDQRGIHWHRWGWPQTLAWHEIQTICMIQLPKDGFYADAAPPTYPLYWIESTHAALMWTSAPPPPTIGRRFLNHIWPRRQVRLASDAEQPTPTERLCQIVMAHTSLPLCDLTQSAKDAIEQWTRTPAEPARREHYPHEWAITRITTRTAIVLVVALIVASLGIWVGLPRH